MATYRVTASTGLTGKSEKLADNLPTFAAALRFIIGHFKTVIIMQEDMDSPGCADGIAPDGRFLAIECNP